MDQTKLSSLYSHWCVADSVRYALFVKKPPSKSDLGLQTKFGEEILDEALMWSGIYRMTVLYGLMYVVIEGYRELKDRFDEIDTLLARTDFVNKLRLFRNSVFHFQPKPFDHKQLGFLEEPGTEEWMHSLHKAFFSYFKTRLPLGEFLEFLKKEDA